MKFGWVGSVQIYCDSAMRIMGESRFERTPQRYSSIGGGYFYGIGI